MRSVPRAKGKEGKSLTVLEAVETEGGERARRPKGTYAYTNLTLVHSTGIYTIYPVCPRVHEAKGTRWVC